MSSQSQSTDVAGIVGEYNAVAPTFNDGDTVPAQFDVNGQLKVTFGGVVDVSVVDPLPAGTNNIGDVDVLSLPSIPAGANSIGTVGLNSGSNTIGKVDLNAGTNAIGKLAANSGVDIGDVDVTSVIPGSGATNLGKAEDAGHTSGDVGVMALGVRNDSDAALSDTDLDYTPFAVDSAGRLKQRYLSVVDQIDTSPGPVWDTSSTNIQDNAGVFTVAVASLAAKCRKIRIADTTGKFIGVYTGGAGLETLAFIINPGMNDEIEHEIAAGTRITLRHMANTDIIEGELCMQFLG